MISLFLVFNPLIFQLTQKLKKEELELRWFEKKVLTIGLSSTSILLDFLDSPLFLSLLYSDQIIFDVTGTSFLSKYKTLKKSRSFL